LSNTYSQIYIQIVFAVQNKNSSIDYSWEERLYQYISSIVQNKGNKMIAINGMPDHIHMFVGLKPNQNTSDLVREIKKASTEFINSNKLSAFRFNWQEGYGAFSYSRSHIDNVYHYIMNQKSHHNKITFKDEYVEFLKKYEIEYDERYLFDWIL
jgi:putative transposase